VRSEACQTANAWSTPTKCDNANLPFRKRNALQDHLFRISYIYIYMAGFRVSPASPWTWATPLHRATTKRKNIYILVDIKKIHGNFGDLAHVAGSSFSDFFFIPFFFFYFCLSRRQFSSISISFSFFRFFTSVHLFVHQFLFCFFFILYLFFYFFVLCGLRSLHVYKYFFNFQCKSLPATSHCEV
jgi:hypothetical protein